MSSSTLYAPGERYVVIPEGEADYCTRKRFADARAEAMGLVSLRLADCVNVYGIIVGGRRGDWLLRVRREGDEIYESESSITPPWQKGEPNV